MQIIGYTSIGSLRPRSQVGGWPPELLDAVELLLVERADVGGGGDGAGRRGGRQRRGCGGGGGGADLAQEAVGLKDQILFKASCSLFEVYH